MIRLPRPLCASCALTILVATVLHAAEIPVLPTPPTEPALDPRAVIPFMPTATGQNANPRVDPPDCARSPQMALDRWRSAWTARDVNAMSALYHWSNTPSAPALAMMDTWAVWLADPVMSIDPWRSSARNSVTDANGRPPEEPRMLSWSEAERLTAEDTPSAPPDIQISVVSDDDPVQPTTLGARVHQATEDGGERIVASTLFKDPTFGCWWMVKVKDVSSSSSEEDWSDSQEEYNDDSMTDEVSDDDEDVIVINMDAPAD